MAQNKTGFDPTQTAEYWLEKDVYTVPLQSRSKRPKTKNWPHLRLVEEDLKAGAFKVGDNIGALWGEPSAHATDVDLDMDEAIWVAEHLLPETLTYGRSGKEYSHYIYRVAGAKTKKWQVAELGTIVEIRSTGAQSVIPPSRHPEGGFYFMHDDVEFVSLTKLDLERYCDEIAVAAVFLHYYPDAGSRHDFVHACTGTLCHQRWPADKIKRVMGAVLTIIQEEDDEMDDRMTAVVNTIEKHEAGDRTKGFTTLADWMSMPVITALRRWTQTGTYQDRVVTPPVVEQSSAEPTGMEFDEQLLEVPGLVGEVASWSRKTQYLDQPIFALASGIMCTALASSNHYTVQHWDTPLQPYLMVTAATGGGKDSVLSSVSQFTHKVGLEDTCFRGFQSYYAMLDILAEEGMACWLWDEAARYMANIRNSSGQDFTVLTHVISLYGSANKFVAGVPGRRQSIPALDNPFITLLATAQPDALMEALTGAARETGFVNRFILMDTGDYFPPRNMHRSTVFPSALKKRARDLIAHEPRGTFTEIVFEDTDTYQRFDQFEESSRRRSRKDETWARANQNALMLAGVAAVGVDANRPMITPDIATWAIRMVTWSNDSWASKMRFVARGESYAEKNSLRIEAVISQPQKYINQKMTSHQRIAIKNGMMPDAVLKRNTRNVKPHEREQILNDLMDADIVGCTDAHENTCFFKKSFD
jgi:hypothetical protein